MDAEEALRQGNLDEALQLLESRIRQDPATPQPRIFLFQILAVQGNWERALRQLKTLGELDPGTLAMAWCYRNAIQCEILREKVFQGESSPTLFGEPREWGALLVEALKYTAQGKIEEGTALRSQAFEQAPAIAGTLDDQAFTWIADADSRIGPMLELMIEGRYGWAPFEAISELHIEPPTDLRDLVWIPVHLRWRNGGESPALMPSRYPFSYRQDDPLLALSRKTEWSNCGDEFYLGFGQRMWTTDRDEYPLLTCRHLSMRTVDD